MQIKPIVSIILLATIVNVLHGSGQLLLKSGFESPVRVTGDMGDLMGSDHGEFKGWDATPAWIESSRFVYLVGRDKNLSDYMKSFITQMTGPFGNTSHVLCMQNIDDDPDHKSTSRNEYSFFGRKPPHDYKQGYVRYWMKLQADLADRISLDRSTPWYMIMEWKEPNSGVKYSDSQCRAAGEGPAGSNNYRINIGIHRSSGSKDFHWLVIGQHPQPCRKTEWSYTNPHVKVPLGQWFLVEGYMKKHATEGRVYFAVNGEVVIDTDQIQPNGFTGRTQHADNPLELRFWSPLKNYHSMDWNRQGPVSQWYDDFELWSDFPSGHPATHQLGPGDKVIFREHFSYPDGLLPERWWSEGNPAEIRNGRLYVHADTDPFSRSTVWLNREFSGDLRVEYDACVLSSRDRANNLNFFFLYSDPNLTALYKTREQREDGNYPRYHSLNGYIITNVTNNQEGPPRHRLRLCPGFQLVAEQYQYENRLHTVYHISIEKRGRHITYTVDGRMILEADLPKDHEEGLLGFRTWHTELWWDNLMVTQLSQEPVE
jgi:hypothetical protein